MIQCPECYTDNVTGAVECRDCKKPLLPTSQVCRNGHPMDPSWSECSYCRAEGRLPPRDNPQYKPTRLDSFELPLPDVNSRKTLWEPAGGIQNPSPLGPGDAEPMPFQARTPIFPPAPPSSSSSRKTVFLSSGAETSATPMHQAQKIVAVLVTYTWKPEGQIFPIREGRNRIGQDGHKCDISLPHDDTMSSVHSSISFRTKFVISDLDSMSGTYVNGTPVEDTSYPLENYAQIRTGSTVWTFVILHPSGSKAE